MSKGTASIGMVAWTYYFLRNKEIEKLGKIWEQFGKNYI